MPVTVPVLLLSLLVSPAALADPEAAATPRSGSRRPPLTLAVLVDESDGMASLEAGSVARALLVSAALLAPADRLAILGLGAARLRLGPLPADLGLVRKVALVGGRLGRSGQVTDLAGGLADAADLLASIPKGNARVIVVLAADRSRPPRGTKAPANVRAVARTASALAGQGVAIDLVLVGRGEPGEATAVGPRWPPRRVPAAAGAEAAIVEGVVAALGGVWIDITMATGSEHREIPAPPGVGALVAVAVGPGPGAPRIALNAPGPPATPAPHGRRQPETGLGGTQGPAGRTVGAAARAGPTNTHEPTPQVAGALAWVRRTDPRPGTHVLTLDGVEGTRGWLMVERDLAPAIHLLGMPEPVREESIRLRISTSPPGRSAVVGGLRARLQVRRFDGGPAAPPSTVATATGDQFEGRVTAPSAAGRYILEAVLEGGSGLWTRTSRAIDLAGAPELALAWPPDGLRLAPGQRLALRGSVGNLVRGDRVQIQARLEGPAKASLAPPPPTTATTAAAPFAVEGPALVEPGPYTLSVGGTAAGRTLATAVRAIEVDYTPAVEIVEPPSPLTTPAGRPFTVRVRVDPWGVGVTVGLVARGPGGDHVWPLSPDGRPDPGRPAWLSGRPALAVGGLHVVLATVAHSGRTFASGELIAHASGAAPLTLEARAEPFAAGPVGEVRFSGRIVDDASSARNRPGALAPTSDPGIAAWLTGPDGRRMWRVPVRVSPAADPRAHGEGSSPVEGSAPLPAGPGLYRLRARTTRAREPLVATTSVVLWATLPSGPTVTLGSLRDERLPMVPIARVLASRPPGSPLTPPPDLEASLSELRLGEPPAPIELAKLPVALRTRRGPDGTLLAGLDVADPRALASGRYAARVDVVLHGAGPEPVQRTVTLTFTVPARPASRGRLVAAIIVALLAAAGAGWALRRSRPQYD